MKILVVDDSVSVRKALERILSTRQIEVMTAGSAEEALQRLAEGTRAPGTPALVIADVVMPGMDGFELCKRLKADPAYEGLPVLLISGIVNQKVSRQAQEVGATDIVKKPFTPEDLFPKIERALAVAVPERVAEPITKPITEQFEHAPPPNPPEAPVAAPHVGSAALEKRLLPLLDNAAVEAALLADVSGELLAQVGRGLDDAANLAVYSRTLASIGAALGDNLGLAALSSLHLDYEGRSLLITRVPAYGTLLLRVKDASSLGVARYLVRKFLEVREVKAEVSAT